ncbi:hypothetical protein acdb102_19400 [Acidothermaceae bacterium B102]|nr:hypothetical protein acdb102_19400 [Acidothermaceae bacterium B102]
MAIGLIFALLPSGETAEARISGVGIGVPRLAATTATPSLQIGVSTHYHSALASSYAAQDFATLRASGIRNIREDLLWKIVQPTGSDTFDWAVYDRFFATAAAQGMTVLPILGYGTGWATGSNLNRMPSTAVQRTEFANFSKAVVLRYGAGGSFWKGAKPGGSAPVTAVEVWNEPWFPGPASPRDYSALVLATSAAVKSVAPSIQVVANVDERVRRLADGSTQDWGAAVLNTLPDNSSAVDAWAIHPYPRAGREAAVTSANDALAQVADLQLLLGQHHQTGNLWVTEVGFSSLPSQTDPLGSPTAAANAVTQVVRGWSQRKVANPVTRMYLYTYGRQSSQNVADYRYALLRADGTATPTLVALANAVGAGP